jgi:uncharacterized glyoxalase superfamily protein PhnB/catechol 2,3-dioxygenase-like lactoylglutathione lyase family enzyme
MSPEPVIAVRDVEASSRWYQRLLGCESGHGGPNYERLVQGGRLLLQLHAWDHEDHPNLCRADSAPRGHGVLLWFETGDFEGACERARGLGAEVVLDVHVNPNARHREIWLRDPDGYVVVIAGPDGEAPEGKVSSARAPAPPLRWQPHLVFDGDCDAALRFYAEHLGGFVAFTMTYGDSPMAASTPVDCRDRVLHATLVVGYLTLTAGDALPGQYVKPQGMWIMLHVGAAAEADRVFAALAGSGTVHLAIAETFWARRFGMVVDRFGTPWIVQCSGS